MADLPVPPLGINWLTKFIARHPQLCSRRDQMLEIERVSAQHPLLLRSWFSCVDILFSEIEVADDDIWNADEIGARMNHHRSEQVIWNRRRAPPISIASGNTQWTSVIECVNATGRYIKPLVAHQGTVPTQPFDHWFPPTQDCPNFYWGLARRAG